MLLAELVATSTVVGSTSRRSVKVAALADLLRRLPLDEVEAAVGILIGRPRQGRVGVGWASVRRVDVSDAPSPTLTVAELDRVIDQVERTAGPGSVAERHQILTGLFARATRDEAAFLGRLLLGEVRQGALEGVMAEAVAKAAGVPAELVRRAAMLGGDLGRTAVVALAGGAPGLMEVGLSVMRAVQPMLAASATDVEAALAETGRASVEWKLDGARIQVHRAGDEVAIFTRNLNDITDRLPSVVAAVRALPVDQVVLDGESIGLDERGRPHRFQDTMSTFSREGRAGAAPAPTAVALQAFFFDVLHLDGEDLIDRPLQERLSLLDAIARPLRLPALVTADPAAAAGFAAEALAAGHEGVMVKALDCALPGGAPGRVVAQGEAGADARPRRAGRGVGSRASDRAGSPTSTWGPRDADGGFVMVGKTFKGLTDDLLRWQTDALPGSGHRHRRPGRPRAARAGRRGGLGRGTGVVAVPGRGGPALRPGPPLPRRQAGRPGRHHRDRPVAARLTHAARTMRPTEVKWHNPANTVQLCHTSW